MPSRVDPSSIVTGAGSAIPGSVSQSALGSGDVGPSSGPLDAHLLTPADAHPASAISIQDLFERYLAGDVEGALGELAALVPPAPGPIGSVGPPWLGSTNSGVPDWGILKLWDGALNLSAVNTPDEIYPYYWRAPISRSGDGTDGATDPIFNVVDPTTAYTGGGNGKAHATFATVLMDGLGTEGYPSWRTLPSLPLSFGGDIATVVSGIVSPADRGVIALVTWPAGDLSIPAAAASIADIQARCLAALLLGEGLGSSGSSSCDGTPGGIFTVGSPTPYDFPGQASGQPNLVELHTGSYGGTDASGQVRLLTDPTAVSFSPGTTPNGMPIFGATTAARGSVGTDSNFFAYRLPYLKDYSAATGLVYTPVAQKPRFFNKIQPAQPSFPPFAPMNEGGGYDDFTTDYWAIQIARYRHRIVLGGPFVAIRRGGSYALAHFRREADFESYVVDGVVPTSDKLYSLNMISWDGAAQVGNLVDLVLGSPTTSPAYTVNSAEVIEDPGTALPALFGIPAFTLSVKAGATSTEVSGVSYFVPRDPALADGNPASYNMGITDILAIITSVFTDSVSLGAINYRSHDKVPTAGPLVGDDRFEATNQNPAFLSLSSFSYEGDEVVAAPASTILVNSVLANAALFPAFLGQVRRQRIEFGYADLSGGLTNPLPPANAAIQMAGFTIPDSIVFTGDANTPVFTENAKVRVGVRKALVVDPSTGYPVPQTPLEIPSSISPTKYLYHSMKEIDNPPGSVVPTYGNPSVAANAVQNPTKDREERFLDEIYRYPYYWLPSGLPVATRAQLLGSGLPGGFAPIPVPVRPINGDPDYPGYYFSGLSIENLITSISPGIVFEAQVAGLPERDAPYTDGVDAPFPSRGILIVPQDNYSVGYNPAGPNYFGAPNPRRYQRCFDAGAANVGASSIIVRFWGVELADFAFVGPGPGGVGLACLVKIPGATTWMDAGRVDGSGPSKQDPALDGAGCLVSGPNTFNLTDPASQIRYAQVEVSLGPLAALFLNTELPARCPVLIQIILKNNATGLALNWRNVFPTDPTSGCRGLVGIEIVVP